MAHSANPEDRYARAEQLLGEWLAAHEAAPDTSFDTLVAANADVATELRELGAQVGAVGQAMADGRALVEAQRLAVEQLLAGLGSSGDFSSRYTIESEVGKGGMGAVFRVLDKKLGRPLAMKVILGQAESSRTGKTPGVAPLQLQRFLNEARITSQLEHPGIVPVHEVGVDADGRAYFTMKLVKGRTLADVLDMQASGDKEWSRARVLQVVQRVCEALAYAHEKGVVHRDLKPANIMVGDFGEVYVMDWGLARRVGDAQEPAAEAAVDEALSAQVTMTKDGTVVGTPAYMPPEQAGGRIAEIGPHSDVYAIGAMLYQSIAGYPPYCGPGESMAAMDVLRHIGQGPPQALANRTAPPELVAICARAMTYDWHQRYQKVGELAAELRAFLEGRVVKAYASGAWAEARKWMQRNRALSGALATMLGTVVIGVFLVLGYSSEARASAREKTQRAEELEQVLGFQESQMASIDLARMGARLRSAILATRGEEQRAELESALAPVNFTNLALDTLRANTEMSLREIKRKFPEPTLAKARLLQATATALHAAGLFDLAVEPQEEALQIRRRELGDEAAPTLMSVATAAKLLLALGRLEQAEPYYREVLETRRRTLGAEDPATLTALNDLGFLLQTRGLLVEAKDCYRTALEANRRLRGPLHADMFAVLSNMAGVLLENGEVVEAESYCRQSLEGTRRLLGDQHPHTIVGMQNLASLLQRLGKLDEAERLDRASLATSRVALGDTHPTTLRSMVNLASVLREQDKLDEADSYCREALATSRRLVGSEHLDTVVAINSLGTLLQVRGQLEAARALFAEALETSRRALGEGHAETLISLQNLASVLQDQGKREEAELYYRQVVERRRRTPSDARPDTLIAMNNFGTLLLEQGKLAEGEECLREALEASRRVLGENNQDTLSMIANLGRALQLQGKLDDAATYGREALGKARRLLSPTHRKTMAMTINLGSMLLGAHRHQEAFDLLAPNEAVMRESFAGPEAPGLGYYLRSLGVARAGIGDPREYAAAEANLREAYGILEALRAIDAGGAGRIALDLVALYAAWDKAEPGKGYEQQASEWQQKAEASGAKPGDTRR